MVRRVFVLLVIVTSLLAGCASNRPVALRVMTYNIHHGQGMDKQIDLERIARIIREAKPDLVALQEVERGTQRTHQADEPARLAEMTGMTAVFEKNIDLQGGEYGNAVLSRLPIAAHEHYLLPRMGNNEQRGVLETHIKVAGGTLVFFATHLDHQKDDAERLASVAFIRQKIAEQQSQPVILAGDFNAEPDSPALKAAAEFLRSACPPAAEASLTFPADEPTIRIDHVLYNGHPALQATGYRVLPEATASDHRPVVADFEVRRLDR